MGLQRTWTLHNTLAGALEQVIEQLEAQLSEASVGELVEFVDGFLPGRTASPEWTASLERLAEVMWSALPTETMEAVGAIYASREGPMWQPLVNKFSAEHGQRLLGQRWRPAGARRAAVVLR